MIIQDKPLSIAEAKKYFEDAGEKDAEVLAVLKKFVKISGEEAKEIKEKIGALDLMKVSPKHLAKIIDLMPEDSEELNKIFTDVGLDEDENKRILEIIKEFK